MRSPRHNCQTNCTFVQSVMASHFGVGETWSFWQMCRRIGSELGSHLHFLSGFSLINRWLRQTVLNSSSLALWSYPPPSTHIPPTHSRGYQCKCAPQRLFLPSDRQKIYLHFQDRHKFRHQPKVVEGKSLEDEQKRKLNLLRYRMTLTALMIVKSLLVVMTHLSKIPPWR